MPSLLAKKESQSTRGTTIIRALSFARMVCGLQTVLDYFFIFAVAAHKKN
jgi:hypothetical protein